MTEIRTTSKAVLRRMLKRLDRLLHDWDSFSGQVEKRCRPVWYGSLDLADQNEIARWLARRREVRRRLKERRHVIENTR